MKSLDQLLLPNLKLLRYWTFLLIFCVELSIDTNTALFPQGSSAKSTCIANAEETTILVDLLETTDPLRPQRQDEFQSVSIEGNQDPDTHHIQGPSTASGSETHSSNKGKSTPLASKKDAPCAR